MCGFFKKLIGGEPEILGVTKHMEEIADRIPFEEYERLVKIEMDAMDKLPIKSDGSTYIKWGKKKGDQWVILRPQTTSGVLDSQAYRKIAIDLVKSGPHPPGMNFDKLYPNNINGYMGIAGFHSDEYGLEATVLKTTFKKKDWVPNEDQFFMSQSKLTHELILKAKTSGQSILILKAWKNRDCPECKEKYKDHHCGVSVFNFTGKTADRTNRDNYTEEEKKETIDCPDCKGVGCKELCHCSDYLKLCMVCLGDGKAGAMETTGVVVNQYHERIRDIREMVIGTCAACHGTGWIVGPNCPKCGTSSADLKYRRGPFYGPSLYGLKDKCKRCGGDGYIDCPVCKDHKGDCPTCGGKNNWLMDAEFYKVDVHDPKGDETAFNMPQCLLMGAMEEPIPQFFSDPKDLWIVMRSEKDLESLGDLSARTILKEKFYPKFKDAKVSISLFMFKKFELDDSSNDKIPYPEILVLPGRYCSKVHKFLTHFDMDKFFVKPKEELKVKEIGYDEFLKVNWINPPMKG